MTSLLRRLALPRLLLLCGVVVVVGIGATALAEAVMAGPTPPPKALNEAVHHALSAPRVSGVSANIQFTNHLLEGASLATGGGGEASQLSSSPLLSGASGRLWIGSEGHARLELQSEKGDTQILWDGKTADMYDASTNTLYRYTPAPESSTGATPGADSTGSGEHKVPSATEIQEGIEHLEKHAVVSKAQPASIAGQPAYTVRVSPRETGSLIGGAELSWDAVHGAPLRAAIYSTTSSAPVIELAATEVSFGPVEASVLDFTPPSNAKVQEVKPSTKEAAGTQGSSPAPGTSTGGDSNPHVTTHGSGLASIVLVESHAKQSSGAATPSQLQSLPKIDINGTSASELQTALGTLLSFERAGVRYVVAGSVTPGAVETFARGL